MNYDPLTEFLLAAAHTAGISPVAAAFVIPFTVMMAARGARMIPDSATGPLKWLRIAFKIVGLYTKDNSGVPAKIDEDGVAIRRNTPDTIPEQAELLLDSPLDIFATGAKALKNKDS